MIFRQVLRDDAIAMLKAANTLAGDQVSKEQAVPSPEAGLPLLAVYVPLEHKTSISEGGAPLFRAVLTLHIEARVANADPVQVVTDLDTLIDQAQIGLLCNPDFMRSRPAWPIEYVSEIVVRTEIDGSGETYIGKGLIALTVTYRDEYPPLLPNDLQRIVMTIKPQLGVPPPPAPWPSSVTSETSLAVP
jgi:hypothetical protein